MQEQITTFLRSWVSRGAIIIYFLGNLGVGAVALIRLWLDRRKPWYETEKIHSEAELNESEAELNKANAKSIEFNDSIKAGEVILKLIRQAGILEFRIIELNEEIKEKDEIIKNQKADIEAYERQRQVFLGKKKLGLGE